MCYIYTYTLYTSNKEQFDDARRSFEKLEGSVEGLKALGLDRTAEATKC